MFKETKHHKLIQDVFCIIEFENKKRKNLDLHGVVLHDVKTFFLKNLPAYVKQNVFMLILAFEITF